MPPYQMLTHRYGVELAVYYQLGIRMLLSTQKLAVNAPAMKKPIATPSPKATDPDNTKSER